MKTILPLILLTGVLAARTVTINGVDIEVPEETEVTVPPSTVEPLIRNPDVTATLEQAAEGRYNGTAVAKRARRLLQRISREGLTDANVAAAVRIEEKADNPDVPAPEPPAEPDPVEVALALEIARGFDTGLGFRLGLTSKDREAFSQMLLLVNTARANDLIDNNTPQTIADIAGNTHTISTKDFIRLMIAYGNHYKWLWDQSKGPR